MTDGTDCDAGVAELEKLKREMRYTLYQLPGFIESLRGLDTTDRQILLIIYSLATGLEIGRNDVFLANRVIDMLNLGDIDFVQHVARQLSSIAGLSMNTLE